MDTPFGEFVNKLNDIGMVHTRTIWRGRRFLVVYESSRDLNSMALVFVFSKNAYTNFNRIDEMMPVIQTSYNTTSVDVMRILNDFRQKNKLMSGDFSNKDDYNIKNVIGYAPLITVYLSYQSWLLKPTKSNIL